MLRIRIEDKGPIAAIAADVESFARVAEGLLRAAR